MELSEKLLSARCRLLIRDPWYGHFAMQMDWKPSEMEWLPEEQRTMGVYIKSNGRIECIYYPPFAEKLTIEENFAVIQHEIEHVVRLHCVRRYDRDPYAFNIAADMTINGEKDKPRIGYDASGSNGGSKLVMPMADTIVWMPKGWPTNESAEWYYDKIMEEAKKPCQCSKGKDSSGGSGENDDSGQGGGDQGQGGGSQGQGQGGNNQGKPSGGCPKCGKGKYEAYGRCLDDHSIWSRTEVSEDQARQIVKATADEVTQKCQGNAPGHLSEALKSLGKPVVRWRDQLKHFFGRHVGSRRVTHSRRNRRRRTFGMPGISHHAAATVAVVVDTSGSVSPKELEQFFAEIDAISSRAKISVLQWDYSFQGYTSYRRNDWKKFKINGRGGTDMAAPMKWLMDNGKVPDLTVMFTDGECNYLEDVPFPAITVISGNSTYGGPPKYGHTIYLDDSKN